MTDEGNCLRIVGPPYKGFIEPCAALPNCEFPGIDAMVLNFLLTRAGLCYRYNISDRIDLPTFLQMQVENKADIYASPLIVGKRNVHNVTVTCPMYMNDANFYEIVHHQRGSINVFRIFEERNWYCISFVVVAYYTMQYFNRITHSLFISKFTVPLSSTLILLFFGIMQASIGNLLTIKTNRAFAHRQCQSDVLLSNLIHSLEKGTVRILSFADAVSEMTDTLDDSLFLQTLHLHMKDSFVSAKDTMRQLLNPVGCQLVLSIPELINEVNGKLEPHGIRLESTGIRPVGMGYAYFVMRKTLPMYTIELIRRGMCLGSSELLAIKMVSNPRYWSYIEHTSFGGALSLGSAEGLKKSRGLSIMDITYSILSMAATFSASLLILALEKFAHYCTRKGQQQTVLVHQAQIRELEISDHSQENAERVRLSQSQKNFILHHIVENQSFPPDEVWLTIFPKTDGKCEICKKLLYQLLESLKL